MTDPSQLAGRGPMAAGFQFKNFWHLLPWVLALAFYFHQDATSGGYLSLGRTVLIAILFTLSVDLALGYAGIITLGQAAFYGFAAYTAGILSAKAGINDPLIGLLIATAFAALLGFLTGMLILHTEGVTIMMLTLAVASILQQVANQWRSLTGGDDGLSGIRMSELMGVWKFDFYGKTAYLYCLAVLFVWFCSGLADRPFAFRPVARRHSPEPAPHARDRYARLVAACGHVHHLGCNGGLCRRALRANDACCRPVGSRPAGLWHRGCHAGSGR